MNAGPKLIYQGWIQFQKPNNFSNLCLLFAVCRFPRKALLKLLLSLKVKSNRSILCVDLSIFKSRINNSHQLFRK